MRTFLCSTTALIYLNGQELSVPVTFEIEAEDPQDAKHKFGVCQTRALLGFNNNNLKIEEKSASPG